MTEVLTIRVRVFAPDEFAGPDGWPEDVGIAVLLAGEAEIFPVHRQESVAGIVARIGALSGRDLAGAAVFPVLEGHPVCDLPFTSVARLRAEIESFLERTADAVEEAADFSVNFGFAAEEGLDLSTLVKTGPSPSVQTPDVQTPPEEPHLEGYARFDPDRPIPVAMRGLLTPLPSGELLAVFGTEGVPLRIAPADVLVRQDGLGLALRRVALGPDAALPGQIILPAGCLGLAPASEALPVLAVTGGDHVFISSGPDWASEDPSAPVADLPAPTAALPFLRRAQAGGIAALFCIVAALSAVLLQGGDSPPVLTSTEAVPMLRAELFD